MVGNRQEALSYNPTFVCENKWRRYRGSTIRYRGILRVRTLPLTTDSKGQNKQPVVIPDENGSRCLAAQSIAVPDPTLFLIGDTA
ncbi:MAG: hypothetical protein RMY36_013475 [Nostoc sp. SerVER01]|nr:hypothetical protein [Nostoc sp. SerVER01]